MSQKTLQSYWGLSRADQSSAAATVLWDGDAEGPGGTRVRDVRQYSSQSRMTLSQHVATYFGNTEKTSTCILSQTLQVARAEDARRSQQEELERLKEEARPSPVKTHRGSVIGLKHSVLLLWCRWPRDLSTRTTTSKHIHGPYSSKTFYLQDTIVSFCVQHTEF